MVRIIKRVAEHYDVHEVVFGRIYTWRPESIIVECECGERSIFKSSELLSDSVSTCECGKDQMSGVREEMQDEEEVVGHLFKDDEDVHPWRYWHTSKNTGIPF